jgi:leucine dehydrogenase
VKVDSPSFEDVLRAWEGEEVVAHFDEPTGTWMFVCIHSTVLGPSGGGTRMKVYARPGEALADGARLAEAMTAKFALAGLPMGGAKGVLAVPALPEDLASRRRVVGRYAEMVASLGGSFRTGPDVNTSEADMDIITERCPWAFGRSSALGGSGSSAPDTALGVFHGIRATLKYAYGSHDVSGRTVLVQGVGEVGSRLTRHLVDAGAKVVVSDVDESRVSRLVSELGVGAVQAGEDLGTPCDVFAPCALGGVLSSDSIGELRCGVVAGAANNQLARPEEADALRAAGILYAPAYVINGGGALHLIGLEQLGWSREELDRRLEGIGATLQRIYVLAEEGGESTEAAATRLVEERLAAAGR